MVDEHFDRYAKVTLQRWALVKLFEMIDGTDDDYPWIEILRKFG